MLDAVGAPRQPRAARIAARSGRLIFYLLVASVRGRDLDELDLQYACGSKGLSVGTDTWSGWMVAPGSIVHYATGRDRPPHAATVYRAGLRAIACLGDIPQAKMGGCRVPSGMPDSYG
jgi:hypothetical protein